MQDFERFPNTYESCYSRGYKMETEFEMLRGERRSIFISNKLWKELENETDNCFSVSTFIRQAILEKLVREHPKKKDYFKSL